METIPRSQFHLQQAVRNIFFSLYKVRGALDQVLESDEDLAGLYLTVQARSSRKCPFLFLLHISNHET